ncbi:MAG: hypothetical protein KIG86_01880 [Eubacteriales bacterium]|nr:hypothetical protein [Eubacteriales bacterium]
MAKEYIEREAAKARLRMWITDCVLDGDNEAADRFRDCIDLLDSIPAADVAPVRRGRWTIAEDDYYRLILVKCSVCHDEWCFEERDDVFDLNYHYCPNCGAYMMGENNGKCE